MKKPNGEDMGANAADLFRFSARMSHIQAESHGISIAPIEVDRRSITINGRNIIELEMSDGKFRVFIDGLESTWSYADCIRWAGGFR